MDKIKLNILGLSYSQTQSGAYALVLAEENGKRRLPIIIGSNEAQSIAIQLEGLVTPRPLTHDLFVSFATTFNIYITEVNIFKLEEGIFYSELVCDNGKVKSKIDARTSDAVALALRFRCPIYTTEKILAKAGIVIDFDDDKKESSRQGGAEDGKEPDNEFSTYDIEELEEMMNQAIKEERYEQASLIRDEINKRKNSSI
jgi:bifunctional DNase/RNase